MRLLRKKRRWDPNARKPNCRGKGISTCRVMPGKMNLCSWQVTAGKGAVRLQDCTQLRILCMHCTQKMQPIIVRRDSSADVSRDPGCRSYLNPTPGIPRTASRFPAALQSMNMEQRTAHKKFNATILLSQAGDPGIFFGFGRRLFFFAGVFDVSNRKTRPRGTGKIRQPGRPFSFLTRGRNPWYSNDNPLFYVNSITDPFH